jgi:acylphosphatase
MSHEVFHMDCWFEGHVQGVGFRYQTLNVARGFEVTGTVRNLDDGRVHLYAEGDESEVRAFQLAVSNKLESFIRTVKIKTGSGLRTCRGFNIAR